MTLGHPAPTACRPLWRRCRRRVPRTAHARSDHLDGAAHCSRPAARPHTCRRDRRRTERALVSPAPVGRLLTLFSIPKPFAGRIGVIQWNALRSWCALPDVQVVLVGDEAGVAAAAHEVGVEHVGGIAVSESGTPLLDDAFACVESIARKPLRCFVNADIIFGEDLPAATRRVANTASAFLLVGETIDVAAPEPTDPETLARRARAEGRSRGATAIDYFVFTPGLFDPIPPVAIGRARFDNWLVSPHGNARSSSTRHQPPRRSPAPRLRAYRRRTGRGALRR